MWFRSMALKVRWHSEEVQNMWPLACHKLRVTNHLQLFLDTQLLTPSQPLSSTSQYIESGSVSSISNSFNDHNSDIDASPLSNGSRKRKRQDSSDKMLTAVPVPLKKDGTPKIPILLPALTIHSLGVIAYNRPKYHTKNCIFPIGYKSSRMFASIEPHDELVEYVSTILDGGDDPIFQVSLKDMPHVVFRAATISAAWLQVQNGRSTWLLVRLLMHLLTTKNEIL